jgi:hypothetical protein
MRTAQTVDRVDPHFELEALDPLPCGCVAGIFRVGHQDLRVMSLEAKGPYCLTYGHSQGRIVEPGEDEVFD